MTDADEQHQRALREMTDHLNSSSQSPQPAEAVWRGRDSEFAQAMANELGVLVNAERAVVAINRTGQTTMEYAVQDDSSELSVLSGTAGFEVTLKLEGQPVGRRMSLTGVPAQRVMGHCAALVNRVQARWCAGDVGDG